MYVDRNCVALIASLREVIFSTRMTRMTQIFADCQHDFDCDFDHDVDALCAQDPEKSVHFNVDLLLRMW
jgi:hypothetical protein